jgi:HlyD family secretion protein
MRTKLLRRASTVILGAGLLGAIVYAFLPEPVEVETVRATRGTVTVVIEEEGRATVRRRYTVSAPVSGSVLRTDVKAGDRVASGTVLLKILPAPIDVRTGAQLAARAAAAEDVVERSRATERAARAAFDFAASERARAEALGVAGALSRGEVELSATRFKSAEGEWRAAEAASRAAVHEAEEARAAVTSGSDASRGRAVAGVKAPVAGIVLRVFQESERVVAAGTPLVELADPADLEVIVDLLSSDAVRVPPGATVLIDHWGGSGSLSGRVRLIEPASFTKVSALGVEEQRVNLFIDLIDPRSRWERLGDGYGMDVRIVVAESVDVVKVPAGAVFRDVEGWSVFVIDGSRARLLPVTIGLHAGHEVEITTGLAEGEEVILHPTEKVADGVRVARR